MAHLIIWGDPRSVLAGGSHAGADEVRSLAGLEAALDGRGAALVLAEPERLAAEKDALEAWLRSGGSARAVVVAVAAEGDGDDVLERFPFVDDVIERPVSPARLRLKLERAIEAVHSRRVIRQLENALSRKGDELSALNKIGMQLSAERDMGKLLELILQKSREITGADAGSLYLVERARDDENGRGADQLRFKLAQNDTVAFPFEEKTMPLDETSIAGYVAVTGDKQNVADAYRLPEASRFHISRSFDEVSGYRTRSMLVVPMRDHENKVIGVVQLINKKRDRAAVLRPVALVEEQVIPFTTVDEELAGSLASQAAVAVENADLIERIRKLFETFVHAAVAAVEQRDPTTSGHSERVAILTVGLMERVDQVQSGPLAGERYSRDQIEEVRYAALLHDFGKVAVQEKYLRKGKKLYASQMIAIRQRFAYILKAIEADYLSARLHALENGGASRDALLAIEAEYARRRGEAERVLQAVLSANEPTVTEAQTLEAVRSLPARRFPSLEDQDAGFEDQEPFPVEAWAEGPFLSSREVEVLSIRKGSLSAAERKKIESHVSETYKFLQKLPWTADLQRVPEIAWAHHEKLDGSGYPRQLKAPQIPRQSRMMTISDIYDALVAWDRPYKRAVSEERARTILCEEAQAGKVDQDLLRVFLEAEVYRLPAFRKLLQRT
jgi:HD-GYP domain-containing protein (c-di-GMP phosphodiesterase class II)